MLANQQTHTEKQANKSTNDKRLQTGQIWKQKHPKRKKGKEERKTGKRPEHEKNKLKR